jgi:hypothetical protein
MKPKEQELKKEVVKVAPRIPSKKKRRRSRWSIGSLPQKKRDKRKTDVAYIEQSTIDSNSNSVDSHCRNRSRSSSKASEASGFIKSLSTNISKEIVNNSTIKKHNTNAIEIKTENIDNLKSEAEVNYYLNIYNSHIRKDLYSLFGINL